MQTPHDSACLVWLIYCVCLPLVRNVGLCRIEYVFYILCSTTSPTALTGSLWITFSHLDLHSCSVKTLNLYGNEIGDIGAEKLAEALPSLTNLKDAWLGSHACVRGEHSI